jgi:hypothetical protein
LAPVDRGFGPNAERAEADHSVPLFICDPEDEAHEIAMRRPLTPAFSTVTWNPIVSFALMNQARRRWLSLDVRRYESALLRRRRDCMPGCRRLAERTRCISMG